MIQINVSLTLRLIATVLVWILVQAPASGRGFDAASIHLEHGRYAQAIDAARARLAASPDDSETWSVLGAGLAAVGEVDAALEAYRQADADHRLDVEVAVAKLELVHRDAQAARERLRRVFAAYRDGTRERSARELIAVGDAVRLLARDDASLHATALAIYEQAIRRDREDPATHVAIGDLLLDRYNNTEALQAYRAALAIDHRYAPALLGIARSHHFDRSTGTMDAVRLCLEAQPTLVSARVLLARLHVEFEQYAAAERELTRALDVNARSPEALTLAAAVHYLRGARERFVEMVEQVRTVAPGYSTKMYHTLAEIAAQNRRYADAVHFALVGVDLDRRHWRTHAQLGINRLRLGDIEGGRQSLELAFQGDPFDVWTKNTLDLLDRLEEYEIFASRRFVLVAHPREARVLAPYLLELAEQAYHRFVERYAHRPRTPIRIEVYDRHQDFSVRTVGLVGVDIIGVSFGPVVAFGSPSPRGRGAFNWGSVLWHELAHTFHLDLTGARVPRWFSEGLAVFEEHRARRGWGADVTPSFLAAFRAGRLVPVSELNQAFLRPSYPEQVAHAYYQGALLMELIERDHGFDAISRMLQGYRDGRTTVELVREVLGVEREQLDAAFDAFVRARFGYALDALFPDTAGDASMTGEGRYPRLLRAAREALEADDLERAQRLLLEAQFVFPEHAGPDSPYRLLASVYARRNQPRLAIAELERNIAIDADDLEAHRELAALYMAVSDPDAAARVFEQALLIQPFDAALHEQLAGIFGEQGQWSLAAQARAAVVGLDPPDPAEARYLLADALSRAGQRGAARREVLAALEVAPLYEDALELLLRIRTAVDADPGVAPAGEGEQGPNSPDQ